MPPDPQVRALLDQLAEAAGPPPDALSVADMRAGMQALAGLAHGPEVGAVDDLRVGTSTGAVTVRLYRPAAGPHHGPLPLLVWLHGGGFVAGDLDTADPTARDLCARTRALVASVDYPLAPEHRFPAAAEACIEVTRRLRDEAIALRADPTRMAVGGESAGANLAAVVAQATRADHAPRLALQLLVYPVTDFLGSHPSVEENGQGYLLTTDTMRWFAEHYLPAGADRRDPRASPLYATDLAGLPPTYLITAELDPLRDEGEAYAGRLQDAGVPVSCVRHDGMVHGFFTMTAVLDAAGRAVQDAADALVAAWGTGTGRPDVTL